VGPEEGKEGFRALRGAVVKGEGHFGFAAASPGVGSKAQEAEEDVRKAIEQEYQSKG
jgi:hypothetical protein